MRKKEKEGGKVPRRDGFCTVILSYTGPGEKGGGRKSQKKKEPQTE